jgi:hypothetical protein
VRVILDPERLSIRLTAWEKALGLMGDISVQRSAISDVRVLDDGVREAMRSGLKAGLRVPWVRYVARTIALDEAFLVKRGVPTVAFSIADDGRLRRVLVSTPEAGEIARELTGGGDPPNDR